MFRDADPPARAGAHPMSRTGKSARLPGVLVVDDEVRSQEALRRTLDEEFEVFTASSADEAWRIMERETVHIVLCDQRMPGESGVGFLKRVRAQWPDVVRLIISGYTDSEDIIAGINEAGIYQYLLKPWQPDALLMTIRNAAELFSLQAENQRLSLELRTSGPVLKKRVEMKYERVKREFGLDGLTRGPGSPLNPVCDLVGQVAPFDLSVLISGESGTGKEMLARAIHYQSRRAERAFVVQNCGALPDQLLEAELFGYKRGAFTGAYEDRIGLFQQADGGTLFLDEIGETSPAFQVKLLRVLQEGEFRPLGSPRPMTVDVRVIAATNRDLETEVREGRFREDFYYRLNVVPVHIPALAERREDIPVLAEHFIARFAAERRLKMPAFAPDAIAALQAYDWPGNVRQLRNIIERTVILAPNDRIGRVDVDMLPQEILGEGGGVTHGAANAMMGAPLREARETFEREYLRVQIRRFSGNISRTATFIGMERSALHRKLKILGMVDCRGEDEEQG